MCKLNESTVVYVEDDVLTRTHIATFLSRRVKKIYEANNGEEGLSLITEQNPDAIITDLEMPVMNGLVMIKKVRELLHKNIPIIVITGYADEEHFTELADAYLYKPINMFKLTEVLEELLGKQDKAPS